MHFFNKKFFSLKKLCGHFKKTKIISIIDNEPNVNIKNIFKKQSFTLKELCHYFLDTRINLKYNKEAIQELCKCYLYFSSNNVKYKQYLKNIKGNIYIFQINNIQINLRSILQEFDFEFNKLIVGIRTETTEYDITVSWDQFNEKIKFCNKELLETIFVHKEEIVE